jgi:thioester reductase-like protein
MLTGATGFLGAHLLDELLRRGRTTIYALVRCRDHEDGRARIRANQARYDRWDEEYDDRIVVVPGDLAQPYFGMEPDRFDDVAARLDAVYHNGATVDTLSPYGALSAANVGGTHEALRLASRGRLKRLHYVSTIAVAAFEGRGEVPADSSSGYEQSKWVAEELVRRAGAAGLPVTIFRPAMISGDTRTGGCNAADSFYRFVRGCIAFGAYPDVEMSFDIAPVDFVARQIVDLSVQDSSIAQTFHIEPERPLTLGELAVYLTASGFPVHAEDYREWRSRLAQADAGHPLAPLAPMFDVHEPRSAPDAAPPAAAPGVVAVTCPVATAALIDTYTDYLSRSGLLQRPASRLALAGSSRPS